MAQLIKPQDVKIVTKQGECEVSIVLELNININADGLQVTAQANNKPAVVEMTEKKEKEQDWFIPEFSNSTKVNFGKTS